MIRKKLISQCYIKILEKVKSGAGFTLIELIVVISVAAVISLVGIAAFVSYSQTQELNTAAADIANMFSLAKSRAASGVKPTECTGQTLDGYRITLSFTSRSYQLYASCSADILIGTTSYLPSNILFLATPNPISYFFPVLVGGVKFTGAGTIVLSGFGKIKTLRVDSLGNASTN